MQSYALTVDKFLDHAAKCDDTTFELTPIGTGLAGYTVDQIAPMFKDAPKNVELPLIFEAWLAALAPLSS